MAKYRVDEDEPMGFNPIFCRKLLVEMPKGVFFLPVGFSTRLGQQNEFVKSNWWDMFWEQKGPWKMSNEDAIETTPN